MNITRSLTVKESDTITVFCVDAKACKQITLIEGRRNNKRNDTVYYDTVYFSVRMSKPANIICSQKVELYEQGVKLEISCTENFNVASARAAMEVPWITMTSCHRHLALQIHRKENP